MPSPTPSDYSDLRRTITAAGLLKPQTAYYVMKTIVAFATLGIAVAAAIVIDNVVFLMLAALVMAFASTQIALLAHDVGHYQAYRSRRANMIGRVLFGNLLLGVSHTWWNTKHNQHHSTPNHMEKDPDIAFPFVVFDSAQIADRPKVLRPIIAWQVLVFPLVLPLQALNMRISSITHLREPAARRPVLQALGMAVHFSLYGLLLYQMDSWAVSLGFFAIHQSFFGVYNSSVFASNHKGMPLISEDARLDFLREQVITSRDVTGRPLTDFWYGGLNYQIEHHLFPTMPRNNLAKAQLIVRAYCEEKEISYHETGLLRSYGEVFQMLHEASAPLRRRWLGIPIPTATARW